MAKIKTKENQFEDIGKFKEVKRLSIMNKTIYELVFKSGSITLNDKDKGELQKSLILK